MSPNAIFARRHCRILMNLQCLLVQWFRSVECKTCHIKKKQQELSYRKQIARQLRTQYAEGMYRHKYYTVTLKSRLRVTQGHWKRNHWIDHTWLSSSRVIWCWLLLWPWNVGQRSLKVIESGAIWKLGYGFLFAFHSNYGRIFSHFPVIQRQRVAWFLKSRFGIVQCHWKWHDMTDFLVMLRLSSLRFLSRYFRIIVRHIYRDNSYACVTIYLHGTFALQARSIHY